MESINRVRQQLADGRLATNLIAFYGLIVVTVIGFLVLRRWLARPAVAAVGPSGSWLNAARRELSRRARTLLLWLTLGLVVAITATGILYHVTGGDVRRQAGAWVSGLTPAEALRIGLVLGALIGVAAACRAGVWLVRRSRPILEASLTRRLGGADNEALLKRWFGLVERYGVAAVRLLALVGAGYVVGAPHAFFLAVEFALRVTSILVVARLVTLACRTLTRTLGAVGDQYLGATRLGLYWERVTRLFPFGERCCDAAVYVTAASLCVQELAFIDTAATYGPRVVGCIGILFGTRVLIELVQVLLNQAFGMYDEGRPVDQKARTLVPLLESVSQYVLYFGAGVYMLDVLGMNTLPILAGAGILGLAVGLGAQSLVTDLVSGFFILFEGQYLVGDYVQIGEAAGMVESVGIRLTQVRDSYGKLYLIPNGQIKGVVNFSKGYVNAVVDLKVPAGSDLEGVFRSMTEAGRKLRQTRKEVLADTEILGLVELGTSDMTVRAVTRVRPGTHSAMQNEYRRLLKFVLDENGAVRATKAA